MIETIKRQKIGGVWNMIDRICISINNRCNLQCRYCHFRDKVSPEPKEMDVFRILDNVKSYAKSSFKIGFVGDGEPFLDFPLLKSYIEYLKDSPFIETYTITNGTIQLKSEDLLFLKKQNVKVGFSLDGPKDLHDKVRCTSYERIMENLQEYYRILDEYPTFNATIGGESIKRTQEIISFFRPFKSRVTFSRMIGKDGISLKEYNKFLSEAESQIPIRRGGKDCTMYGGSCAVGENNFYFAQGFIYLCGNCVDLSPLGPSDLPLEKLPSVGKIQGKNLCFKEKIS